MAGVSSGSISTGGADGFFSKLRAGLADGAVETARDILPIWAENALTKQSRDQLNDPTFNSDKAPSRIDTLRAKFQSLLPTVQTDVTLDNRTRNTILAAAAVAAVGLVLAFRK